MEEPLATGLLLRVKLGEEKQRLDGVNVRAIDLFGLKVTHHVRPKAS